MILILDYHRMKIYWEFKNEEVIFLLDCYTNVYASVGFGQKMRGGDITVLQFFQDSVFLSDRFGIGQVTPTVDKQQDVTLLIYYKVSNFHHKIKFSRKMFTGDRKNFNLKYDEPIFLQYAIHNTSNPVT